MPHVPWNLMSVPLETISRYVPNLVLSRLARDRGDAAVEPSQAESVLGAVLFSDISGFTALTERLAKRGPVGAEELSDLLNRYFGSLIAIIFDHGGDVLKLAGDALVAFWRASGDDAAEAALRATQCAAALQAAATEDAKSGEVRLQSKIGIGVGHLVVLHVGGVLGRWEFLIAGEPLVQMGLAEKKAGPGTVVLSPEAHALVDGSCTGELIEQGYFRLESVVRPLTPRPAMRSALPSESTLRGYLPAAILSRLDAGQTAWLAELRVATVLFINLSGFDVSSPREQAQTQEIIRTLQTTLYHYEGSFNKLSIDEKGLTLVAGFGFPPLAHEDDPIRALHAALEMHAQLGALGVAGAIGIATGRVYCGEIGGARRREYTVMGDQVNLAARLMQAASGRVLCDASTCQATRGRFKFERLAPVSLKGKAEPVAVFRPCGLSESASAAAPLFGRDAERARLRKALDAAVGGHGGVVTITGEPGIGKSRLVDELVQYASGRAVNVLQGAADAIEKSTPYYAWRSIVARLLGVESITDPEQRSARVTESLANEPELGAQASLLNPFLSLDLPDNELTATMVGRVRADNTHALVLRLLERAAGAQPTAVVLEDAHWFDSASWALAHLISRRLPSLLLVFSTRPLSDSLTPEAQALLQSAETEHLRLDTIAPADVIALACDRLGVSSLPPVVAEVIQAKSQGHPFFIEELAFALRDSGLIEISDGTCRLTPGVNWGEVAFPDSVQGVITNRIDRLSPQQQMTLKVSSVIGRLFSFPVLSEVFPIVDEKRRLPEFLGDLNRLDFTFVDTPEPQLTYAFKHVLIREVSYSLLLFSHRRQLHRRIAEWYEEAGSDDLAPYYSLLAHHWSHAEDDEKAIEFFERAGEQALRGGAYQEAVIFFRDALALADRSESREVGVDWASRRACWEAKLGEAHLGLGQLGESREHTVRALGLLGHPVPKSGPRLLGEYVRQLAQQAWNRLVRTNPPTQSEADRKVLTRASCAYDVISQICYYSQEVSLGVYSALRALNLAERAGPCPELARSYGTMCIAASLVPLHSLAEIYGTRAGETAETIDDWATRAWVSEMRGIYWLSVGRFDASRQELMKAVEITRRIGDWRRWEESLGELARLEYLKGNFALGAERFGDLWEVARQQGHEQAQVWGRHGQASNILRQGRVAEAVASLEESPALRDDYQWVADRILGFGLLALARFRLGRHERAHDAAEDSLREIARTRPVANFNLEGYAGTAEVYLGLWERALDAGTPVPNALKQRARSACSALRTFARIFPIGRPRSFAWQGLYHWLCGRKTRAARSWRQGLYVSERMEMPYEKAIIHFEIARHAADDEPTRTLHLAKASELFTRLEAADDLARLGRVAAQARTRRAE